MAKLILKREECDAILLALTHCRALVNERLEEPFDVLGDTEEDRYRNAWVYLGKALRVFPGVRE